MRLPQPCSSRRDDHVFRRRLASRSGLRVALAGLMGAVSVVCVAASFAGTLGDLLRERGITGGTQTLPNLDKAVTSYQSLDDERVFLVAYYVDQGSGRLNGPLLVSRFDKVRKSWKHVAIQPRDARAGPADCLGSVTRIDKSGLGYHLGTHLNPSAGCTIILSPDLAIQGILYGWFLAAFRDGRVVYHNSQVHFAPTHSAEISIYDPGSRRDLKIYPMKPYQTIRTQHIGRVRATYSDEAWCRSRNHHCDPELFDNDLAGEVAVNDSTDALAFVMAFDNTVYWTEEDRWRLEAFRAVRRRLANEGPGAQVSDGVFSALLADLGRIERLAGRERTLAVFKEDPELQGLLSAAFAGHRLEGQSAGAFLTTLDPRWQRPEIWSRLAKTIDVPPEFTEVIYVYRNVTSAGRLEYRETLLRDFRARWGDIPLRKALDRLMLKQIFGT